MKKPDAPVGPPIDVKTDMLEKYPNLKEFFPYSEVANAESARGQVLVSTGFIEEQLKQVLAAFMLQVAATKMLLNSANAPLGTFSSRIAACYALGLIAEVEHHDLTLLRRIRNDFAHSVHISFETPSVVTRCKQLRLKAMDYTKDDGEEVIVKPQGQFMTSATGIILGLVNRPEYVSRKRLSWGGWKY